MLRSIYLSPDGTETAVDDVRGGPLCPKKFNEARSEDIGYIARRKVYRPSSRMVAKLAGRSPIAIGWLDTNKGAARHANYPSCLVGEEYRLGRRGGREAFIAATPPSECLRMLLNIGVHREGARRLTGESGAIEFMALGAKNAKFYAPGIRDMYISMPREDTRHNEADPMAVLV